MPRKNQKQKKTEEIESKIQKVQLRNNGLRFHDWRAAATLADRSEHEPMPRGDKRTSPTAPA